MTPFLVFLKLAAHLFGDLVPTLQSRSTLLVIGGFVWGSMYRPDSSTLAAELKTELTQIKQTIAVQQEQNQLGEIESQIETLKAEIQKSRNL